MNTAYDRHAQFYLDFVDKGLAAEEGHVRLLVATIVSCLGDRLANARVLDLCCGEGYLGRMLVQHGAGEVVGIDLSAALITAARQRAPVASGSTEPRERSSRAGRRSSAQTALCSCRVTSALWPSGEMATVLRRPSGSPASPTPPPSEAIPATWPDPSAAAYPTTRQAVPLPARGQSGSVQPLRDTRMSRPLERGDRRAASMGRQRPLSE